MFSSSEKKSGKASRMASRKGRTGLHQIAESKSSAPRSESKGRDGNTNCRICKDHVQFGHNYCHRCAYKVRSTVLPSSLLFTTVFAL